MALKLLAMLALALAGIPGRVQGTALPARADSVRLIDLAGLEGLVRENHQRVLVINIWATWCVPCVEEIPDLVTLSNDPGIRVIGVSIDDPEDLTSRVIPFLTRKGVTYPVFVKAAGHDEDFINALNNEWSGVVPVTFIYDTSGRQRAMLVGKQTLASFRKAVREVRPQ